jgi:polysaccharide pyruvyl transferase CsaB
MRVVLSGYFGFGNIGDEAILEAMIVGLRNKLPSIKIIVLSSTPEKTAEMYNVRAVDRLSYRKIRRAISECDVLISGGGGLIQDVTGFRTIPYYLGIIYLAKRLGKTAVILGQGFGPVRNPINRLLTKWILNRTDLIIVRDEKSSEDMISLGVKNPPIHVTGDVTAILPLLDIERSTEMLQAEGIQKKGRPLIGISIRPQAENISRLNRRFTIKRLPMQPIR